MPFRIESYILKKLFKKKGRHAELRSDPMYNPKKHSNELAFSLKA